MFTHLTHSSFPLFRYQTISDLQDLLDKLEDLHRIVFNDFRSSDHNECRIASLVPVIEESYGIYKFITSMLSAMHALVDSPDPLVLLVERYASQFRSLKRFYEECSKIRYLTSLINIPKLPEVRKLRHITFLFSIATSLLYTRLHCHQTRAQSCQGASHPAPADLGKGSGEHRIARGFNGGP